MRKIYLDNAATTQLREEVINKMQASLKEFYGNPSSTHSFGRSSKTVIEKSRKTIAKYLNAQPSEIIFTSGGTEADNMILLGAVRDLKVTTIITAKTEHHAVLNTIEQLKKTYRIEVKYVALETDGTPDLEDLSNLLASDSSKKIVSLMHVNNEIGNIIDIDKVADLCKEYDALFHSDTVQSIGHLEWDLQKTQVDFLTAAAHKFHGPKGIGFAFIRKNSGLKPMICGGEQERGYRAGTEYFHNIVGLETSFTLAYDNLEEERAYVADLKAYFISSIKEAFPTVRFNGSCQDTAKSTYTLVNITLPLAPQKSEILLFHLDINGIACSKGSACQSGSNNGSHVLNAILRDEELEKTALRFSFSKFNTKDEIDYVVKVLVDFSKN